MSWKDTVDMERRTKFTPAKIKSLLKDFGIYITDEEYEQMKDMTQSELQHFKREKIEKALGD